MTVTTPSIDGTSFPSGISMNQSRPYSTVKFQDFDRHMQALESDDYEALVTEFNEIPQPPFNLREDEAMRQINRSKNRHAHVQK